MHRLGVRGLRRNHAASSADSHRPGAPTARAYSIQARPHPEDYSAIESAAFDTEAPLREEASGETKPRVAGAKRERGPRVDAPARVERVRSRPPSQRTVRGDERADVIPDPVDYLAVPEIRVAPRTIPRTVPHATPSLPVAASASLLKGDTLAAAIAAHPHLSLAVHNRAPTLPRRALQLAVVRFAGVPPARGTTIDISACTAPFHATRDVGALAVVLGLADIYANLRHALQCMRSARREPVEVLVPLAIAGGSEDEEGGAVLLRRMLYVPDAGDMRAGSGWVITQERWEQRTHGGARR